MTNNNNNSAILSEYNHDKYIDFRSDTVTMPSFEMLQTIQTAKLGDDVYDEDIEVLELQ